MTTAYRFHSTDQWRDHFTHNASALLAIPWDLGVDLSDAERSAIADSIAEFQLGESSEGKHLIRQARRYAEQSGDVAYPHTLGLFIAEEHRHARDLGRVMDLAGIPRARKSWPDTVFRWLRHRAGLELSIAVLVTAEIIAKVYYAALREATNSPVLRRLCDQICADELAHVEFQTERLAVLRLRHGSLAIATIRLVHRIFFAGTCVVVWHKHRHALKAGGYGFLRFCRLAWEEFIDALNRADPRRYVDLKDSHRPGPVAAARTTPAEIG
jgi:hypothetical protein